MGLVGIVNGLVELDEGNGKDGGLRLSEAVVAGSKLGIGPVLIVVVMKVDMDASVLAPPGEKLDLITCISMCMSAMMTVSIDGNTCKLLVVSPKVARPPPLSDMAVVSVAGTVAVIGILVLAPAVVETGSEPLDTSDGTVDAAPPTTCEP